MFFELPSLRAQITWWSLLLFGALIAVLVIGCDVAEEDGETAAPELAEAIGDQVMTLGADPLEFDLEAVFDDPTGEGVTFDAVSFDEEVASASLDGSTLVVAPVGVGETDVAVTAQNAGGVTETEFAVTVEETVAEVDLPLKVSDGAESEQLWFGLDPTATDGLDEHLEQDELPPRPPSGVFDARFVGDALGEGSLRDYREGGAEFIGEVMYTVAFQRSDGGGDVTLEWSLPKDVTGVLQDPLTGGDAFEAEMEGDGSTTVENENIDRLDLQIDYVLGES